MNNTNYEESVPRHFWHESGKRKRQASTVKELKALLAQIPDDMPIEQGFGQGVEVVVFNISYPETTHLSFNEIDED